MLKHIFTYLLIIAGCGIIYISTSLKCMDAISAVRNESDAWWAAHNSSDKGDLVNMAYLDYTKKFHSERDYIFHKPQYAGGDNINLFMQGDSYTFKIPDSAFLGVHRYEYAWVGNRAIEYDFDSTRKSILVVERTERYIRSYFKSLNMLWDIYHSKKGTEHDKYASAQTSLPATSVDNLVSWFIPKSIDETLTNMFNKNINQNLEYNLFNYNVFNAPRLAKAWLNYRIFNRASGNVTISEEGDRLFLSETLDNNDIYSSYSEIAEEEYNNIRSNMNFLYNYYREEGFDEMYLAIIPNPVTILQPEGYNNLIPMLQNDTALKMKFIDIYSVFKETDKSIFRPGDTHWNNNGIQLWIETVNDTLNRWNYMDGDDYFLVNSSTE